MAVKTTTAITATLSQDIPEKLLVMVPGLLKLLQEFDGKENQIVKIQSIGRLEAVCILLIGAADVLFPQIARHFRKIAVIFGG